MVEIRLAKEQNLEFDELFLDILHKTHLGTIYYFVAQMRENESLIRISDNLTLTHGHGDSTIEIEYRQGTANFEITYDAAWASIEFRIQDNPDNDRNGGMILYGEVDSNNIRYGCFTELEDENGNFNDDDVYIYTRNIFKMLLKIVTVVIPTACSKYIKPPTNDIDMKKDISITLMTRVVSVLENPFRSTEIIEYVINNNKRVNVDGAVVELFYKTDTEGDYERKSYFKIYHNINGCRVGILVNAEGKARIIIYGDDNSTRSICKCKLSPRFYTGDKYLKKSPVDIKTPNGELDENLFNMIIQCINLMGDIIEKLYARANAKIAPFDDIDFSSELIYEYDPESQFREDDDYDNDDDDDDDDLD